MARVNCYLIHVDECGQIDNADLVHSQMMDKAKASSPELDFLISKCYNATLHSVYSKSYPDKHSADKGAVYLRFYKIN